jgi:CheY-like chemotaxis protein
MKFLLIDDDDVTNYINTRIIKNVCAEAQITLALNGFDAIKVLELNAMDGKPSFDVVFVDISMPEMDGWAFIDEVSLPKYEQQQKSFYVCLPLLFLMMMWPKHALSH